MITPCYINSIACYDALKLDLKAVITDPNMRRRMSRVVKMGVSTAMEALSGVVNPHQIDAIITASGFGCLADSEKFLRNILEQDEQLLNPTPFIQSTFNTVGGQVALLCKNHNYNTTYSHRGRSFETALLDAIMRLADGDSLHVLVGCFDENTPTQHRIQERMGHWRNSHQGEGAVFMTLSHEPLEGSLAAVVNLDFPIEPLSKDQFIKMYCADKHIYNDFALTGSSPTASAKVFAAAIDSIRESAGSVAIYNSYMGFQPSIIVLQCL